jgi:hypothetical protein
MDVHARTTALLDEGRKLGPLARANSNLYGAIRLDQLQGGATTLVWRQEQRVYAVAYQACEFPDVLFGSSAVRMRYHQHGWLRSSQVAK